MMDTPNKSSPSRTSSRRRTMSMGGPLTVEDLLDGKLPPEKKVKELVLKAAQILSELPTLVEIEVPLGSTLHVVGDIHGQLPELRTVLEVCGNPVPGQNILIFNGDFVDRGSQSTEVLLTMFALMVQSPKAVFLNRGNHETRAMNRAYGFEEEVAFKYSSGLFETIQYAFSQLPLVYVINKSVMITHGGLPGRPGVRLDDIKAIQRDPNKEPCGLAHDLLWADPCAENGLHPSPRGPGICLFGPDVTAQFCRDNNLSCIIRSHEVAMHGYHWQRGGRCCTVFSAANYVGRSGNLGAVCHMKPQANGRIEVGDLEFTQYAGARMPALSSWRAVPARERSRL